MSTPIRIEPANRCGEISLTPELKRWWLERPRIDDPIEGPLAHGKMILKAEVDPTQANPLHYGEKGMQLFGRYTEMIWDRITLPGTTVLCGTPFIVLGSLIVLTAMAAGITAVTGIKIPGLEILVKNMPLSFAFSLVMVRTGIHLTYAGMVSSRKKNRFRQEALEHNELYRIGNNTQEFSEKEKKSRLCNIHWLNKKLASELQLQNRVRPQDLYGKQAVDLPTGRIESQKLRLALQKLQPGLLPELDDPLEIDCISEEKPNEIDLNEKISGLDKWYDGWHKGMRALGVFDIIVAQIMLVTAAIAIFCVAFPHTAPSSFDLITKDPYLSISVAFLMLSSWVNCTRTGWRMLTYNKREVKRATLEQELQLIDLGIEMKRAKQLCEAIITHLKSQKKYDMIPDIKQVYKEYRDSLPPLSARLKTVARRWKEQVVKHPKSRIDKLHQLGKRIMPYLAKPAIGLGILITLIGLLSLGFSIAGEVPASFEFLASNQPISFLFSCGVIISGFHTIHRGVTMGERPEKEEWKTESVGYRKALIKSLFSDSYPTIVKPAKQKIDSPRLVKEIEITTPQPQNADVSEKIAKIAEKPCFAFWADSLKTIAIPNVFLGVFLATCAIIGLNWCIKGVVPSHFDFIVQDPSFSASFCLSLIAIAIDSIVTSWRMWTYKSRKSDDRASVDLLKRCFEQLFPAQQIPIAKKA